MDTKTINRETNTTQTTERISGSEAVIRCLLAEGVDILYDLAISGVYKNESGKYFDNDKGGFGNAHPDAYDDSKVEQLLSITQSII